MKEKDLGFFAWRDNKYFVHLVFSLRIYYVPCFIDQIIG